MKQECCPTQPPATRPGRHREREHTPVAGAGAARRGAAGRAQLPDAGAAARRQQARVLDRGAHSRLRRRADARDDWHGRRIPGTRNFRALVYQLTQPGFAAPAGPPLIPGPTLHAEVGDVLVVHFGNAAVKLEQALTLHPHGVRYRRTLRKPGLYRIVCTLHEEMTMTIRLRRPG